MSTKMKIIAAVIDTENMVLYKENGDTYKIPQGDPRIQRILDDHLEDLEANRTVEIDLYDLNHYKEMEENTSGMVKFFKTTKRMVKNLLGMDDENSLNIAPTGTYGQNIAKSGGASPKMQAATAEIMKNADRPDGNLAEDETVVAVIDGITIPGVENLDNLIKHCNSLKEYTGLNALLKRMANVIEKRGHSMADLLKFLEKSDMPIADDGSIIAYKLVRKSSKKGGDFVDCHSGNVTQSVGSYVCMDPKLVDPNRRNECSNGLHVGRRAYMGGFHGDTCLMIKIAPEDVIAVPSYDANKVRVCGYHILGTLSGDGYRAIKANRPFTELQTADGKKDSELLRRAIENRLPNPTEKVEIGGHRGTALKITKLDNRGITPISVARAEGIPVGNEVETKPERTVKAVETEPEKAGTSADPVDPRKVQEKKQAAKKSAPAKGSTREAEAKALRDAMVNAKGGTDAERKAAQALLDFKKKKKVSWTKLGLKDQDGKDAQAIVKAEAKATGTKDGNGAAGSAKAKTTPKPKAKAPAKKKAVKPASKPKPAPKAKAPAKKKRAAPKLPTAPKPKKVTAKKQKSISAPAPKKATPSSSREEEARALYKAKKWSDLLSFKRKKKVSWSVLGFTAKEEQEILSKTKK